MRHKYKIIVTGGYDPETGREGDDMKMDMSDVKMTVDHARSLQYSSDPTIRELATIVIALYEEINRLSSLVESLQEPVTEDAADVW